MSSWRIWLIAVCLLVAGILLRSWGLTVEPVGYEEIAASVAAITPLTAYQTGPALDSAPPLYAMILKFLTLLMPTAPLWLMRLPSVIFGALAGPAVLLLARRPLGDRAAALAAFILTFHPLLVFYGREAQPVALFALLLVCAWAALLESASNPRVKTWALFSLLLFALIHTHRSGMFVFAVFGFLHLAKVFAFRDPEEQRRLRKRRQMGAILYNYIIVGVTSLPWLVTIPSKPPWHLEYPTGGDLAIVLLQNTVFGITGDQNIGLLIFAALIFLMLLPPLTALVRRMEYPQFTALAGATLMILIPFAYSHLDRPRFVPQLDAALAMPLIALALGVLIARCNFYIRSLIVTMLIVSFGWSILRETHTREKPPLDEAILTIETNAKPKDVVAFWPDYGRIVGDYFLGRRLEVTGASELIQRRADFPTDSAIWFVVLPYASQTAHPYTFPGALKLYADGSVVWRDRLAYVIRTDSISEESLRLLKLWYTQPETLNVTDRPTSDTQFIFTPSDQVFRTNGFLYDDHDLTFELADGRRCVWTSAQHAQVQLPVSLLPGEYVLRMNCSPLLYVPAEDRTYNRTVTVQLRTGEERRRLQIDRETLVRLSFSTDAEVTTLPVHIETTPLLHLPGRPQRGLGIKIYSISIDQVAPPEFE